MTRHLAWSVYPASPRPTFGRLVITEIGSQQPGEFALTQGDGPTSPDTDGLG